MNLWGNLDTNLDDGNDDSQFNETDFTLACDTSIGNFDVGVGYIYYGLDGADDAEELYLSISAANCPVAPTLTLWKSPTCRAGISISGSPTPLNCSMRSPLLFKKILQLGHTTTDCRTASGQEDEKPMSACRSAL